MKVRSISPPRHLSYDLLYADLEICPFGGYKQKHEQKQCVRLCDAMHSSGFPSFFLLEKSCFVYIYFYFHLSMYNYICIVFALDMTCASSFGHTAMSRLSYNS